MVQVSLKLDKLDKALLSRNYNIIWTECGSIPEIQKRKGEVLKVINLDFQLNAREVAEFQFRARERIDEFRIKGGVHYSGLLDKELDIRHFTYDIGRHNAVDKVIGMNLLRDEKFEERILFTTGRVSSDIVVKCLRTRIPIIISSSGPLSSAVKLARDYNLCLIGYLRGRHFTIFSENKSIVN
jgi:FdhD protein